MANKLAMGHAMANELAASHSELRMSNDSRPGSRVRAGISSDPETSSQT